MFTVRYTESRFTERDMVDRVREALGIADPGNNQWREIYPLAWTVVFLKLHSVNILDLRHNTDWIDIADALMVYELGIHDST